MNRFIILVVALLAFAVIIEFKAFESEPGDVNIVTQCEQWIESLKGPGDLFN